MRTVVTLGLVLVLAGAAQAKGLRFLVVDAQSGAPIAGATVERWASQWQPRILLPPGNSQGDATFTGRCHRRYDKRAIPGIIKNE